MRRRLDRPWDAVEQSSLDIDDIAPRVRERLEKLEDAADEGNRSHSECRSNLDNVDTLAAFAKDMGTYLMNSDVTRSRSFTGSFI